MVVEYVGREVHRFLDLDLEGQKAVMSSEEEAPCSRRLR